MNEPLAPPGPPAAVHPCSLSLTALERAALKHQRPCCIWLTGLSGAGKSTLANLLELRLNLSEQVDPRLVCEGKLYGDGVLLIFTFIGVGPRAGLVLDH